MVAEKSVELVANIIIIFYDAQKNDIADRSKILAGYRSKM